MMINTHRPPGPASPLTARPDHSAAEARKRNRRETIESLVVVVAAFLVWSFEAEGFVIPTGSMAPTLMGRHKEITCPECGSVYTVNADSEVDSSGAGGSTGIRVNWGTCQNCRLTTRVDDAPSVSGDRIYTMKKGLGMPFLPAAGEVGPRRWEVTVFKLPEEPEVRYIKRLVGMPEETIRIRQGDLYQRPKEVDDAEPFRRLLRPFAHQQAMQVLVYDDAHRPASLRHDPRWKRWAPAGQGWSEPAGSRFALRADGTAWTELRYRNLVPDPEQWEAIRAGMPLPAPRMSLITDFSSYNSDLSAQTQSHPRLAARPWFQPHWVGDLTLSCRVRIERPAGALRIELIKGGRSNRCDVDLATGQATLLHEGRPLGEAVPCGLNVPGRHDVALANVDNRLTLMVDGMLPFGDGRVCESPDAEEVSRPTRADLEPVRILGKEAELEVSDLVLRRDIHYTLAPGEADLRGLADIAYQGSRALFDLLSDPDRYGSLGDPEFRDYPLGPGRYLMLGDNSPWSRDGRAWGRKDQIDPEAPGLGWDESGRERWEVPDALIIGKAFCVYWPHLKPFWPAFHLGGDRRFPVRPYVERIRWIR